MPLNDYDIQKKIQDGDLKEFERLFKRYYEPLCRFADTLLEDMDAAEEIVQDFFFSYWKNRQSISIQLSLNAYFYKAVKNNSLAYLRKNNAQKRYADSIKESATGIESISPQEEMEAEEISHIIEETLMKLPERCATVFRMSRFDGKKYQEIAETLAISIKTVEADMGKALSTFREKLKQYNRIAM